MGNCFSAQQSTADALAHLVENPGEPEINLDVEKINKGLTEVANILHKEKKSVVVVAVGGAVNALYLKSRPQTSDVDFFYRTKLASPDVTAIIAAAKKAAPTIHVDEQWLNNHTAVFITEGMISELYADAVHQNVVIFEAPGLKVVAAPWSYAFVTKYHRMSNSPQKRTKDLDDAVVYLHEIMKSRTHPVTKQEVVAWCAKYSLKDLKESVLEQIRDAYHQKFGKQGLEL